MGLKQRLRAGLKRAAITGGLEASWLLARAGVMQAARGRGVIFTLHHVRPKQPRSFDPNAHLEITPEFLDRAIRQLQADGYEFVALDAVPARLAERSVRPFAAFTLDDGYRNNAAHALPVFAAHGVPFTVFVSGGYVDRTHTMWWETAADLLAARTSLSFDFGQGEERLDLASNAARQAAFARIARFILRPGEADAIARLNRIAAEHGIDAQAIPDRSTMTEGELKSLAAHPLASLGAHTISHRALALLDEGEARREMAASADRLQTITGKMPTTFAYPYGDPPAASAREFRLAEALGFKVAVTTNPGTISETSLAGLTALPRVSLNGHFQKRRYVAALASGIPFRLMGRS
ncbi:polysaccharide deacetylase family protein [Rhizobium sp. LjRoot30]|uniref:polysaccharide deacetylase family protein n=1 Tax=Rhizobium sp. LjRoot30 TaxID=3342320 RepID=UPI003ED1156A